MASHALPKVFAQALKTQQATSDIGVIGARGACSAGNGNIVQECTSKVLQMHLARINYTIYQALNITGNQCCQTLDVTGWSFSCARVQQACQNAGSRRCTSCA